MRGNSRYDQSLPHDGFGEKVVPRRKNTMVSLPVTATTVVSFSSENGSVGLERPESTPSNREGQRFSRRDYYVGIPMTRLTVLFGLDLETSGD